MMKNVIRRLTWFEKGSGDTLVGEEALRDCSLAQLQSIFSAEENDPMFDSWPVGREHATDIQRHVTHAIDLATFDYFVEAEEK